MANVIKLKRGSGSDPSASDLVVGEIAIRTDSGKLFTKKDNGSVAEISGAGGGNNFFINTLSSSSGTGGGSASFNGTATRFTLSNPPNLAVQLLVSINGVIQKPNTGTSPSEGFALDGNDIIFASAPATGASFFIITYASLALAEPSDNTVTSAKIVDGSIVNADINASAAIAGTKISPDFGSQNITTLGNIICGDGSTGVLNIKGNQAFLQFTDANDNDDFEIRVDGGIFRIQDQQNDLVSLQVNTDGHVDIPVNLDVGAGLDVTGNITSTGTLQLNTTVPSIEFNATSHENDFRIINYQGNFIVQDTDATANRFEIASDGTVNFLNNVNANSGLDVTGNITVTGTVDGVDIATRDTLFGGLTSSSGVLTNGVTATTQSAGDNSTKIATTAYTDTAISNLVDSSPSTLNTLNELAAALGDDANFSTTVTNSIATKMPLGGGTFSGNISFSDNRQIKLGSSDDLKLFHDGSHSKIVNTTGNLLIGGSQIDIVDAALSQYAARFDTDGAVSLYHNGSQKFNTSSSGVSVTGNIVVSGNVDGRDVASDGSKLDGIEASATADQTASEILTLIKTVDGAGSGLDADTLDGVSAGGFLSSDNADTASGDITFNGGAGAVTINSNSDISFSNGTWSGNHTKIQHHSNRLYIVGGSDGIRFREGGSDRALFDGNGHFIPAVDSAYNLGSTSLRFANVYADTLYGDGSNLTGISTFSGSYNDLTNKPTIPTNNNQLTNGAGYVTSSGNTVIGTDSDINTSGATVVDQLNMTDGVITSHSTRTLTLANLGYTGATNANNITNNSQISNGRGYLTNVHSARSANTNGYVRYRDGTQFVWGNVNLSNTGWTTKSFATAFPSVCRAVIICPNDSSVAGTAQRNPQVRSVNRSNFQGHNGQNTNPANHFFIAVGY
jgi:hypothetical protein